MGNKFYITTAIDYVNSTPHIGTAYEKISADVFARFHRMAGDDVFFMMGNDEHSLNVYRAAVEKGLDPIAYCDQMEVVFRDIWGRLEIEFDKFIRTTSEEHVERLTKFFRALENDFYQGHYEGYYCESCEAFLQEKDLIDGNCPTHGTKPQWIREENYFFRLSAYADRLLDHIEAHPEFIRPETRRNEIVQLIRGGLDDISVTRAGASWGVPFPMNPKQVIYVWVDALTNYVTGVGYGDGDGRFDKWWPADVHIIGKDITRFHCVIWPAMLMGAGVALPKTVFGHGFVYFKGQKLSKSRGVTVDPLEAADMYGPSALRYFLMREGTYGRDVDFTWEQFRSRYDSELANDLGNLVSRTTAMAAKFLDGRVPRRAGGGPLADLALRVREGYVADMSSYAPQSALARIWELVRRANGHIEEEKPWDLAKSDRARLEAVLFDLIEAIRQVAVLTWPVLPGKSEEILKGIGATFEPGREPLDELLAWGAGWPDTIHVERAAPVFPKYTDEDLAERFDVVGDEEAGTDQPESAAEAREGKENMISFDSFKALDLRLARVTEGEKVEGADKLLKLTVDLGGGDTRQMIAGISKAYAPEELIGKTIVVVANLEPTTIRGIESQAMLLAAVSGDELAVVIPDSDLPPGTKVS